QFNVASRTMSGDGSAIVYVDAIANTDPWAKAGVMLRVDQSATSAFAGLFASAQNGVVFEWRTATGAAVLQEVSSPPGGPVLAPVSLKLTPTSNQLVSS